MGSEMCIRDSDGTGLERLRGLASRIEAGDIPDMEELEELATGLSSGPLGGALAAGAGGRMIGVVESVEDGVLSVSTPIGPLQANIGEGTEIAVISGKDGTVEDLSPGLRVNLESERNEEGVLEATGIGVIPEGLETPLLDQFAGLDQLSARQGFGGLAGTLGDLSEEQLAALSERRGAIAAQGGGVSVAVAPLREGPTGQSAGGRGAFSFQAPAQQGRTGGLGLTGNIESIADGVLELTTPRGLVRAAVGRETTITIFSEAEGSLDDLTAGVQVVITREPGEAGSLQATAVTVLPDSLALPAGRPFEGRGGFGGPGFGGGR